MKVKAHLHHALFRVIALSTIAGLAASGCSLPNTTQIDYKSTGKSKISALEMTPDIVNAPENPAEVSSRVLTPVSGMHIERADHARWLVLPREAFLKQTGRYPAPVLTTASSVIPCRK